LTKLFFQVCQIFSKTCSDLFDLTAKRVLTEANKQNMKNRFWPKNQFEDIASRKFHHLQPILGAVPKTFYCLS